MTFSSQWLARTIEVTLFTLVLGTTMPAYAGFKFVSGPTGNGAATSAPPKASGYLQAPAGGAINLLPNGPAAAAASRPGMVEGFANDVPLTVALRQILPRGVMYSVADNVDVGTQVSWTGGRSWQAALDEMLGSVGLQSVYSQNMVVVQKAATMAPATQTGAIKLREPLDNNPVVIGSSAAEPAPIVYDPNIENPPIDLANAPAHTLRAPIADSAAPIVKPYEVTSLDPDMAAPQQNPQVLPAQPAMGALQPLDSPATMAAQESLIASDAESAAFNSNAATPNGPWHATAGQTLHEILSEWAQKANIELNWLSEYDYPVQASMTFDGNFEDAVRTLLGGFVNASPAPIGRLHHNQQLGQMALIIESRGNLYNE